MLFNLKGEIKDLDKAKGLVTGYPSTFGVVDSGRDVVERGAFTQTIRSWGPSGRNRIKALYQHDPAWLVGRPLTLNEDERGLYAETQFSKTAMGNDVFTLIQDGVITEQSIGYDVIRSDPDDDGVRHLRELRLYEYSFVTWGMNEFTPITGAKGLTRRAQLIARMERMAKAVKDGRFESDEMPHMMQIAIEQWKTELPDDDYWEQLRENPISILDTDGNINEDELEEVGKALSVLKEVKQGRVLSQRNLDLVQQVVEALTALLTSAAPDPEKSTRPNEAPQGSKFLESVSEFTAILNGQPKVKNLAEELEAFTASLKRS